MDVHWHERHEGTLIAVEEMLLHQKAINDNKPQAQGHSQGHAKEQGFRSSKNPLNLPNNGTCLHYNTKFCKAGKHCKYSHVCSWCKKKDHKAPACPDKK